MLSIVTDLQSNKKEFRMTKVKSQQEGLAKSPTSLDVKLLRRDNNNLLDHNIFWRYFILLFIVAAQVVKCLEKDLYAFPFARSNILIQDYYFFFKKKKVILILYISLQLLFFSVFHSIVMQGYFLLVSRVPIQRVSAAFLYNNFSVMATSSIVSRAVDRKVRILFSLLP